MPIFVAEGMSFLFSRQSGAFVGFTKRSGRLMRWTPACLGLLLAQSLSISHFGTHAPGPTLSAFFLLAEGICCSAVCFAAVRRSEPVAGYFWSLVFLGTVIWNVAEFAGTVAPPNALGDMLFQFATLPLGMTLFLEPHREQVQFDPLHWADFLQTLLLWSTLYVYFTPHGMAPSVYGPIWNRNLSVDGMLFALFVLRGYLHQFTHHPIVVSAHERVLCRERGGGSGWQYIAHFPSQGTDLIWLGDLRSSFCSSRPLDGRGTERESDQNTSSKMRHLLF